MIEPESRPSKKQEWTEGKQFIKQITAREPRSDQSERVTLECGHSFRVRKTTATAYRCMFCVQDFTGSLTDYGFIAA